MLQTWANIAQFVSEVHKKEGGSPNPSFYRTLGNKALDIISQRMGGLADYEWTNAADGALTISGNSASLPENCLRVDSVEWDGIQLERRTAAELDVEMEGWRDDTGDTPSFFVTTGRSIVFDVAPQGSVVGKLVMHGTASLPSFSDEEDAVNPLSYLPAVLQLAPAYYILSRLPATKNVIREGNQIIGIDDSEIQRKIEYTTLWQEELETVSSVANTRQHERFSY